MKLLIVTQKVDRTDPILGFFHRWIEEYARNCDHVTVVGQLVGMHHLPGNVTVESLGKENGKSLISQVVRSFSLFWKYRKEYDAVLVHMTPVWVLIGFPLWKLLSKRIYLWYEIKRGSWKLSVALLLIRKVFLATKYGIPKPSKRQVIVGHGIDLDQFVPIHDLHEPGHMVTVGRMTRVKNYDLVLRTVAKLQGTRLTIAGGTITSADEMEKQRLYELMHSLGIADRVTVGWVAPDDMPTLLQRAHLLLHASEGGLDKVVLQAMASGLPLVSVSTAASSTLPPECMATEDTMALQAQKLIDLSEQQRTSLGQKLRAIVERDHSLSQCIKRQVVEMRE